MKTIFKAVALAMATVACAGLIACGGGDNADALKVIDVKLTEENYAFAVNKQNAELLESANTYLANIKQDGTFDEIVAKYFEGEGTPVGQTIGTYDASKEQLVVLTNTPFSPFEYVGDDGKYYGVDMEIAQGLAAYLEMELCIIEHLNFDTICEEVSKYENGMVMAGLTVSADRAEIVNFTNTYYEASQVLITAGKDTKFDECTTAAEVEAILNAFDSSVTIGYQNGTTGALYVNGDEDWGFAGFNVTPSGYNTAALAAQALVNGSIDYVIVDAAPAAAIVKTLNELN